MRVWLHLVVFSFLLLPALARAQAPTPCQGHDLRASDSKELLRHWSGMKPFARWRLLNIKLEACVVEGRVPARMLLAPPAAWTRLAIPARIWVDVTLDAESGDPRGVQPEAWRKLSRHVKKVLARAERNRVFRRFVYRYKVLQADLEAEDGDHMRIRLLAAPGSGASALRAPSLTWSEAAKGRIVAYRMQRMDGLPVRPELLRFVEVISGSHPRCVPNYIEGRRQVEKLEKPDPKDEEKTRVVERAYWTLSAELEGKACPVSMAARVDLDGTVSRWTREEGLAGGDGRRAGLATDKE